jgi:hypothetical protein
MHILNRCFKFFKCFVRFLVQSLQNVQKFNMVCGAKYAKFNQIYWSNCKKVMNEKVM